MDQKTIRSVLNDWIAIKEKKHSKKKDKMQDDEESDENSSCQESTELEEASCKECGGMGSFHVKQDHDGVSRNYACKHCKGTGKAKDKGKKVRKESSIANAYRSIKEGDRAKHYKGATKPEGLLDKEGEGSKKFAKDHVDSMKVDDTEEKGHADVAKAGRGGPGQTSDRSGTDKLTNGDKKIVNPVKPEKGQLGATMESTEEVEEEKTYDSGWVKSKGRIIKDKSGAKHDPQSRAMHLSRLGLKKQLKKSKVKKSTETVDESRKGEREATLKNAKNPAVARYRDKTRTSTGYHFTTFKGKDDPEVKALKTKYKGTNKRVSLVGRVPKDVDKSKKQYSWGGNIQGGTKNAARHDVYVHDKSYRREDVEPIDEISSELAQRYVNKAVKSKNKAYAKGEKARIDLELAMANNKKKAQKKAKKKSAAADRKYEKRDDGIERAETRGADRYDNKTYNMNPNEDTVNQNKNELSELRKSTYASYIKKAARSARASSSIGKGFDDDSIEPLEKMNRHSEYNVDGKKKDPQKRAEAEKKYNTLKGLSKYFKDKSSRRMKGIDKATDKLAK